jgi:hypothetical protein
VTSNTAASGFLLYYACSTISGITNACSTGTLANGTNKDWLGSFQTAEAIQEWPSFGVGGDFAQTAPFKIKGEDEDEFLDVGFGLDGPTANDPFVTETYDIGSPGTPIGTSCVSDSNLNCNDDPSQPFTKFQWVRPN